MENLTEKQNEQNNQYAVCMEIAGAESIPGTGYNAPVVNNGSLYSESENRRLDW